MQGALRCVAVDLGDGPTALSTPDVSIEDTFDETVLFADTGIAANARYYPTTNDPNSTTGQDYPAPIILQRATVTVAGGGDTKSGTITLFVER